MREEINKINQEQIQKIEKELEMLDNQLEGLEGLKIDELVMTEGYPYICRCEPYHKKK